MSGFKYLFSLLLPVLSLNSINQHFLCIYIYALILILRRCSNSEFWFAYYLLQPSTKILQLFPTLFSFHLT